MNAAVSLHQDFSAKALVLLSLAVLLGMAPWFSASAVVPALEREWGLSESDAAWLTLAVQLGFVAGTLLSALLNLPDVINTRYFFALCAVAGSAANGGFALLAGGIEAGITLRFLTGLFLAGVYPPGMKLMATWFRTGRGMAIGVLVGALTVGKASPYLINALGSEDWRHNILLVSLLGLFAGLMVLALPDGPYAAPTARFDFRQVKNVFSDRALRLANFGYFGHMWELYAMWTWTPVMMRASLAATGSHPDLAEIASFLVIAAGGLGCVVAGVVADRAGRTLVTSWAMGMSGACCVCIGFLFQSAPGLLLTVAAIWGAAVVADSAQFSACVTELGDPRYAGTALTVQTCVGFLLTTISVRLVPIAVDLVGWNYGFVFLAPGPLFGVLSMLRLRALPQASKIAGGKR